MAQKVSDAIKNEFGRRFRDARDAKKISRAALGVRLGVSPKTIQSWEMGRTFIEKLSLIPDIENELEISVSQLLSEAVGSHETSMAAEATATYGKTRQRTKAGPVTPEFTVEFRSLAEAGASQDALANLVAVPVIRPQSVAVPVADLTAKDINGHVVIPADWVPRGGVLVCYRMADSGMSPMIPLGAMVIIDRRATEEEQALNRVAALLLHNKGLRIRRFLKDPVSGALLGLPAVEGRRGKLVYRADQGDKVLGRIVGILAQPQ